MTKEQHQLDEMVNAIQQVTNISEKKATIAAKREVIHIITQDHDDSVSPHMTIIKLINWASN